MRYFFDLGDGDLIEDRHGVDLDTLDAARVEAVRIASQRVAEQPHAFAEDRCLMVQVRNAEGLVISRIDVILTDAPASGRFARARPGAG